jgi:hypothetical protein
LFLRALWEVSVSGAWMFIFTGHQTMMDKLLDTRIKSVQLLRCQQGTHTHILTSRDMAFEEPLFHVLGGWNCINLLKYKDHFFFHNRSTFTNTLYVWESKRSSRGQQNVLIHLSVPLKLFVIIKMELLMTVHEKVHKITFIERICFVVGINNDTRK